MISLWAVISYSNLSLSIMPVAFFKINDLYLFAAYITPNARYPMFSF